MKHVLITGAAGRIGRVVGDGLARAGYRLRLFDREPIGAPTSDHDVIQGDITDEGAIVEACAGIDCVLHFAGIPEEDHFEPILDANIRGTYRVFEAARTAGVARVVFASTNHVIGFYPSDRVVGTSEPMRPDTLYAASKAYGEALGRMYHDKYGLEVIAVRIGSFRHRPGSRREMATWLSHADAVRLFECCIEAPSVGYEVVYGVSANSRASWVDDADKSIGFTPLDSADDYADQTFAEAESDRFHGGSYTDQGHIGGF